MTDSYDTLIDVGDLERLLETRRPVIVDCRFDLLNPGKGREDYLAGHLPGAVYAHLDEDLAAPVTPDSGRHPLPDVDAIGATLRRLGVTNDRQVVVYDGGPGGIAARCWWMLRWLGHDAVAVLDGGFAAWQAAGLPLEQGERRPEAGDFRPRPRPGWVLTTAELVRGLGGDRMPLLVDAREAPRFRGDSEPIDSAAGHVPGAINFPYPRSLREDGRWRPPAELEAEWLSCLGKAPEAGWAVMCGSGVTACHLALSAERAGLPPPRLYAGSWSEWIRDPARPRAAGRAGGG